MRITLTRCIADPEVRESTETETVHLITMQRSLVYCLLLFLLCPEISPTNTDCNFDPEDDYDPPYFDSGYSYIYVQFEKALLSNRKAMETARTGFISSSKGVIVDLSVGLEVANGTNVTCANDNSGAASTFCLFPDRTWRLCPGDSFDLDDTLDMTFSEEDLDGDDFIVWLSYLHGGIVSTFIPFMSGGGQYYYDENSGFRLKIDKIDCNPSLILTKCVLSQLFSWVRDKALYIEIITYSQ